VPHSFFLKSHKSYLKNYLYRLLIFIQKHFTLLPKIYRVKHLNLIIVDSKQSYLNSLTELFSDSEKYSVVNTYRTLEEYNINKPNDKSIILFELSESNINALAEINTFNQSVWQKYIGLSIYNDSNLAGKAIVAGVSSVISKSDELESFERSLDLIKSGSGVVPNSLLNFLQKRQKKENGENKFNKIVSKLFI